MKSHQNSNNFFWPLAVLLFLAVGVFFTSKEVPQQQEIRSHAQVDQSPYTGAVISLSFSVPGISSSEGNLQPLHPVRNVGLRFYDPDINTFDKTAKPLYVVKAQATFDTDPGSPTYASFVMSNFDLRKACSENSQCVPVGNYQLAFKTDQSVQALIRQRSSDLGGQIFALAGDTVLSIPPQRVLIGDIAPLPDGDNVVDSADYDALLGCFGEKEKMSSCTSKEQADLDDNGVVDGIDYNLLSVSLKSFTKRPAISPTITPKSKVTVSPTPTAAPIPASQSTSVNKNILSLLILVFIFFVLLGGAIFFLAKARHKSLETKEYFIKKKSHPSASSGQEDGTWLTLTDDNGPKLGHYKGEVTKEGFAHIKGTTKKENGKTFIAVSEIIWEKKD